MLTVTNLTPDVQFIGNLSLEPFATRTADFNEAALKAAVERNIVSVQAAANTFEKKRSRIVEDNSTSYTVRAIDEDVYRRMSSDSPIEILVRTEFNETISPEAQFHFKAAGDGQITYVAEAGVTINTTETLKSRKKGSAQTLIYVGNNVWDLIGDLEAAP